jgi:hypothetical protein
MEDFTKETRPPSMSDGYNNEYIQYIVRFSEAAFIPFSMEKEAPKKEARGPNMALVVSFLMLIYTICRAMFLIPR